MANALRNADGKGEKPWVLEGKCETRQWWCIPLIPALERLRQEDLSEFQANLVYKVSSRTAGAVT